MIPGARIRVRIGLLAIFVFVCVAAPSLAFAAEDTQPLRIVVVGNSIAKASSYTILTKTWSYWLVKQLDPGAAITTGTVPLANGRTGYVLRSPRVTLVNAGVNGDRSAWTARRFQSDVARYHPDLVLVVSGTNDVAHDVSDAVTRSSFEQMSSAAATEGARAIFATIPPYDWRDARKQQRAERHNDWLRSWTQGRYVELANLNPAMRVDRGHFGAKGNRVIASRFLPLVQPTLLTRLWGPVNR